MEKNNKNNLPENWLNVRLEDISIITLGQSPPSSAYNKNGDGLPFFQGKTDFGQLDEDALLKKIKISNVVSTADLSQKIDITKLNDFPWGIYDGVTYGGSCGYVKTPEMKGRVTVFSTGKMISIGSNNLEDSVNKLNQAKFYMLQENLVSDIKLIPKLENIIAVVSFGKSLKLTDLAKLIPNSTYNPKRFSGLIFRIDDGLSTLIFSSGKVVITGAKSIQDLNKTYLKLEKILNFL